MVYTSLDRWGVALMMGVLFMILASPYVYDFTNSLAQKAGFQLANVYGCPTVLGIIVHAAVFALVVKLLMDYKGLNKISNKKQWTVALMTGILFALVSSAYFRDFIGSLFTKCGVLPEYAVGSDYICTSNQTLLIDSGIFALIVRLLL